jgi:hypothetical protein
LTLRVENTHKAVTFDCPTTVSLTTCESATATTWCSSRLFEEIERRAGLQRLDDILGALEELNVREAGEIPTGPRKERRIGPRRRRRRYVPADEELASVILRRYQR